MTIKTLSDWTGAVGTVKLGATAADGGTRSISYILGGESDLPFLGDPPSGHIPLVAFEFCDDPAIWPAVVREYTGDLSNDPGAWAGAARSDYGADLVRLSLTSTRRKDFSDYASLKATIHEVLQRCSLPLVIEGSNDPSIDSEVFAACGEAGEGENLLLGTAEAGRYRSVAAAAMAYHHAVIAQSPIDINLAKQLNILLREIGVPANRIVVDPYTGALGYGFEYSYSVMERIRYSALKGDTDLAMPMISAPTDSLTVKEVRDAAPAARQDVAVKWEYYTALASAIAGAAIVCVRHPRTVPLLKNTLAALWGGTTPGKV
ncbi:MAG: acetyl-CoA decarbonylase/synthase complex subunit delta [Methanolinea sp.]|nr:acetyl-CoA decarbonylase/synthase complex subunit delta [Methanolinea sp.]